MNPTAAPIQESDVSFTCPDGFEMPAFLARPQGEQRIPAVLFIYEAFGMNDEMRRIAREVAAGGYAVLMPDLLARGSWFGCIRSLFRDLKQGDGPNVRDLLQARQWLSERPMVDGSRIGVMGLCVGGGFALLLSRSGLFKVSAPFYGQAPSDLDGACPVVASYGGRDGITAKDRARLEEMLKTSKVTHDFKTYEGAGHSFMNHGPNAFVRTLTKILPANAKYNPEAANDAMSRMLGFFSQHI